MDGAGGVNVASDAVRVVVNGRPRTLERMPERSLLQALRTELDLMGTKYGCGEGQCGACTVLMDGKAVHACQVSVKEVGGHDIVTVEGLARGDELNPAQQAFAELGAFQCGFCTPGMVVGTTALLQRTPSPSEAEVREALEGHLCRCCGYTKVLRAVQRASEISREKARRSA